MEPDSHQIAARLVFAGGFVFIWFMFGPMGFAGAGVMILAGLTAREIEIAGRRKRTERERSHSNQSHSQPLD